MLIQNRHNLIYDLDLHSTSKAVLLKPNMGEFHRVGYLFQVQHAIYGNSTVYTEFDAFTKRIQDLGIPRDVTYDIEVHNVVMEKDDGDRLQYASGKLLFTPHDYDPAKHESSGHGTYGAMQLILNGDVVWAYNNHNGYMGDIGLWNAPSGFRDWTFYNNAGEYTIKRMRIYAIDQQTDAFVLPTHGFAHGDAPTWNARAKTWESKRVPYDENVPVQEPNFIILLTGQSNSQGYNAFYDETNFDDQPHDRIFGFNGETNNWMTADMRNESLGSHWHRQPNAQSLAFHFAKRLVEADENIRPGVINVGIAGQCIARWAIYEPGHEYHDFNTTRSFGNQGDIFKLHEQRINIALSRITVNKVNAVCWHQGEADMDTTYDYYRESIYRVIDQYRALTTAVVNLPFILGETTGHRHGDNVAWVRQNEVLNGMEGDGDPNTRCVRSRDLRTNGPADSIHFSANGQRHMGTLYCRTYREMI